MGSQLGAAPRWDVTIYGETLTVDGVGTRDGVRRLGERLAHRGYLMISLRRRRVEPHIYAFQIRFVRAG